MSWMDLLRMSSSNLRRRKLRTFLTVLGVMIGTTSIVVMISLGLGLQASMYEDLEMMGGLNTISVTGAEAGDSMIYYSGSGDEEQSDKRLTDAAVNELAKLEHVTSVEPQYQMSVILLKGGYEGWAQLEALTPEALEQQKLDLSEGGRLPATGTSTLELVYGNGIITNFTEKGTGKGYYETGDLPDIDMQKDTLFLILDQESYYSAQQGPSFGTTENPEESQQTVKKAEKHAVRASGVVDGDPDTYKNGYYNIYCDLETLKQVLKKEFSGRTIPGQPTTKSGKPYKDFTYSSVQVYVDD